MFFTNHDFFNINIPKEWDNIGQWCCASSADYPLIDVIEDKNYYRIIAGIPGIPREQIDASLEGNTLTIE